MNPSNPATTLIDRARLRGASRMIAAGTDTKNVTPEQIQTVANDVEIFCRDTGTTRKDVAKAIGYSASVVTEFLKGEYKGNVAQLAIDLDDWMAEEESRRSNQQSTTFVWTNVAKQIQGVAQYCLDMRKIGLVYGPETSGLGKTTAFAAIHRELGPRRSSFVTIDKCDANPTGLLKKLLSAMRLNWDGNNAQKFQRLVEALKGRSHLFLIDQIHNLRFSKEDRPFYYLTDLYDATNTAQLWAGTSDMIGYLNRQQAKTLDEPLAQVRRRIYPRVNLTDAIGGSDGGGDPLYTVDQIRQMFGSFKLKLTTGGARWLCALARVPGSGGLGICVHVVEYAVMLASSKRLPNLDVPVLKQALQCGITTSTADKVLSQAEEILETEKVRVA